MGLREVFKDERYKENIHTLYSGQSEANLAGPSEGV